MFGHEPNLDADQGAGETAIAYTSDFLVAAVERIDAEFGAGFSKENPALVGNFLIACSNNLGAFMQAATAMQSDGLGSLMMEAMDQAMQEEEQALVKPAPKPRRSKK